MWVGEFFDRGIILDMIMDTKLKTSALILYGEQLVGTLVML